MKKYSPISELSDFAKEYVDAVYDSLGHTVLICDRDNVIAIGGGSKKEYLGKAIGAIVESVMEDRHSVLMTDEKEVSFVEGKEDKVSSYVMGPIIASGDPIGAIIIFSQTDVIGEVEKKAVDTAVNFLARQMEP